MPNWSYNSLLLQGSKKDLQKFYNENKPDELYRGVHVELSFNKAIPRPKDQEENWYDWNRKNWGTKWDARYINSNYNELITDNKKKYFQDDIRNTLLVLNRKLEVEVKPVVPIIQELFSYYEFSYNFDTAWAPPIPWLEVISEKYKNIKFDFEYNIEGYDNGGRIVLKGDEVILQENWNTSDKIYLDNKEDIDNIIKESLKEKDIIYNKLSEEKAKELQSELLSLLYDEGYYINENNISDFLDSM